MKKRCHRGSFTLEAAILFPIEIFIIMAALRMGIDFFQNSAIRQISPELENLDIVEEFYNYQILGEVGEEIRDD